MRFLIVAVGLTLSAATAHAATLTTLANFDYTNGSHPAGGLYADPFGNLYGTASSGGVNNNGTLFKLDKGGALTTVVTFTGSNGSIPSGGLIADAAGNLYGTTYQGGDLSRNFGSGDGTVFKLDKSGMLTTLATFTGTNGTGPTGALIADSAGNFYGTTGFGGASNNGTIFKLDTSGSITTLASFTGNVDPNGGLTADAAGNLYGTTQFGGANDKGTVFKLDTGGVLTTLVSFNGTNGAYSGSGLIADAAGNFYGTTATGGAKDVGTVFKVDVSGRLTTLASFTGNTDSGDGGIGYSSLLIDATGNLYGTGGGGGGFGSIRQYYGKVFKLDTNGAITTLAGFNGANGSLPSSGLIADASGNLYGTTSSGGMHGSGTVFEIAGAGFATGVGAVPEPATWALMLAGFGMTGIAARRRVARTITA